MLVEKPGVRFPSCRVGSIVAVKHEEDCGRCHCKGNSLAREVGGVAAILLPRHSGVAPLVEPRPQHTAARIFSRQTGLIASPRDARLENVLL
jgi:hypothetical protein